MIPISHPLIGEEEERLVLEVLRSGRLVQGPMVERFEEGVRAVVGARHAVAVNNGTSALIAALLALDVGPGDEVVTSPFTFVATLNSILYVGATPRFVDVGDDFNLDPRLLGDAMTPATRAVMPVHLYGQPADMEAVEKAIGDDGVAIVEDAAQALGARVAGRGAGTFGAGCFSFYATKNITTGEGGAITTDDDEVAETLRVLRNQGQRGRYDYARPGFNFRMTELQAALGVAQLGRLEEITATRRANARALTKRLGALRGVVLPVEISGRHHVFHQYTIRVTSGAPIGRDELVRQLKDRGIDCGVYYPRPVFDYECFRRHPRIDRPSVPNAERVAREVLSLPVHGGVGEREVVQIADAIEDALAG